MTMLITAARTFATAADAPKALEKNPVTAPQAAAAGAIIDETNDLIPLMMPLTSAMMPRTAALTPIMPPTIIPTGLLATCPTALPALPSPLPSDLTSSDASDSLPATLSIFFCLFGSLPSPSLPSDPFLPDAALAPVLASPVTPPSEPSEPSPAANPLTGLAALASDLPPFFKALAFASCPA